MPTYPVQHRQATPIRGLDLLLMPPGEPADLVVEYFRNARHNLPWRVEVTVLTMGFALWLANATLIQTATGATYTFSADTWAKLLRALPGEFRVFVPDYAQGAEPTSSRTRPTNPKV